MEIRELESFDVPFDHRAKVLLDSVGRDLAEEDGIELIFERDQSYIRGVAFISRACVSEFK